MRFKRFAPLACLLAGHAFLAQAQIPAAVSHDPPSDKAHPAAFNQVAIPSHGEILLGVMYLAAGAGPHPTVLLLHGFPGYEQNLDLAQAIRRAGWNVLAVHYRGSWGVHGTFSLAHAMEDTDAMVAFLRDPASATKYAIDAQRIVLLGHSMGGYLAASATAHSPAVLGSVMIGTWDITAPARALGDMPRDRAVAELAKQRETEPSDFLPLSGYTADDEIQEVYAHRGSWDLAQLAPAIAPRPVLLLTANDGSAPGSARFAAALRKAGDSHVQLLHTDTDHPFSDRRIYLESLVVNWIQHLPATPAKGK